MHLYMQNGINKNSKTDGTLTFVNAVKKLNKTFLYWQFVSLLSQESASLKRDKIP